jgi:hypothetical protein
MDIISIIRLIVLSFHDQIRLGTLDQDYAEKEWVLRPYMNTARKKQTL